jgi:prepilin-type processing-associated H-X9-DG protein
LCASNHRDLITAWTGYAGENEALCNNFTIPDIEASITTGAFANWANNIMTWGVSGTPGQSVTNLDWARRSSLAPFALDPVRMCKCPADKFLSSAQRQRGWKMRLRSVAMNGFVGRVDALSTSDRSWAYGAFRQFLKLSQIPDPAKTWVFLDEHPDTVNDGFFVISYDATAWGSYPGALHDGSATFSFADGHVELRKWRSSTARIPVRLSNPAPSMPFDSPGRQDFEWYKQNTGYVRY